MTAVTQEFIVECFQKQDFCTKHLYFECNDKLENFSLACQNWSFGKLRFGQLETITREDSRDFI